MEFMEIVKENIRRFFEHMTLSRILDVRRGQAQMDVFTGFADVFGKSRNEGCDIMVCFSFDFMDAFDRESGFFADFFCCFLRDVTELCLCFAGQDFDLLQCIPFVIFGPKLTHFFFCIAFNHVESLLL